VSVTENLVRMASAGLAFDPVVTPKSIRDMVGQLRSMDMFTGITDQEAEGACRLIEARMNVTIQLGTAVVGVDHKPWISAARGDIEWFYWSRYREMLEHSGWPRSVLNVMDKDIDRVLDGLANPAIEDEWDRRGMVIGNVQSGKTANYIGLINKAADAGYKLIVVIAGIHEALRSQTQARIDEGFLGWDTSLGPHSRGRAQTGVGRIDATRIPSSFTSTLSDFGLGIAGVTMLIQNLKEPVVFVVKKNYRILRTLIEFLRTQGRVDVPCLVIDDEADNASINIRYSKEEVSKINELIRTLLTLYPRSAFVAYTATPFANVFIDPDSDDEMLGSDLFPKDFITSLDAPSNYFGADEVFGDIDSAAPRVLRYVEDHQDILPLKHKKDLAVPGLPASLLRAVNVFVVGMAIRSARGQGTEHMSMLVNVSVFTDVQRRVANQIFNHMTVLRDAVRTNAGLGSEKALSSTTIGELHDAWRSEYEDTCSWDELFPYIHKAAMNVDVVEVNHSSSDSLSYVDYADTGRRVIAVGGYSLSRGLTLEGLMVSYFLRNSRMYDTLMQMARWFGYRPGYEDLCRVWMTPSAAGWYAHIAESIDELRGQVRAMEARRATPEEFGLMVRSHPDALMATSRMKMGSAEEVVRSLDLSAEFIETPILHADRTVLAQNLAAAKRLVEAIENAGHQLAAAERWPSGAPRASAGYLVRAVDAQHVINFLRDFTIYDRAAVIGSDPIIRYIRDRTALELEKWDILFPSVKPSDDNPRSDVLGVPIWCQSRTAGESEGDELRLSSRFRVASRGMERAGIDQEIAERAEKSFVERTGNTNVPDREFRAVRARPLLMVHLLSVKDAPESLGTLASEPTAAFSISFPVTRLEGEKVQYVVNATWLRHHMEPDEEEGMDREVAND